METTMLISLAEASNVFSALTVFLVFCAMVIFILRLRGDEFRSTSVTYTPQATVRPIPMVKIENPFCFVLNQHQTDVNDVMCSVSSRVPWMLQALWGVSIEDLHHSLSDSWQTIADAITSETFLSNITLRRAPLQHFDACTNLQLRVESPSLVTPQDLGISPRSKYPLVIFLVAGDVDGGVDRKVGAMINVIHVKDHLCPMTNGIVLQYLKMTDGSLSNLKQLYLAREPGGPEPDSADTGVFSNSESRTTDGELGSEITCVVCHSAFASRALLPCRHVCSCAQCFSRLDKCPMCRGLIGSYFCIREEDGPDETESYVFRQEEPPPLTWRQRLSQWNDSLNQF